MDITTDEKVISLYRFIMNLNRIRYKGISNIAAYKDRCILYEDIPQDPVNIHISYRDRVSEEAAENSSIPPDNSLLSVHKPEFTKCPELPAILIGWVYPGWDQYKNVAAVRKERYFDLAGNELLSPPMPVKKAQTDGHEDGLKSSKPYSAGQLIMPETLLEFSDAGMDANPVQADLFEENPEIQFRTELFEDSQEREKAFSAWKAKRDKWVEQQKQIARTRTVFTSLFNLNTDLEREPETYEMVVANGLLIDRDSEVRHPVLTKRVKISYDPDKNTVTVYDTESDTNLYTELLQSMPGVLLDNINKLQDELTKGGYHPMDRNDTPEYLNRFVHQLSSESLFAEDTEPEHWQEHNRLLMLFKPMLIYRKKPDGSLKTIERIIENIEEKAYIPAPIRDIVSGGRVDVTEEPAELSIEEKLAKIGGESSEILLSKEANKEQLEIAERIDRYNAVLVQGPPGTGKTHTIANITGHLLAEGKTVLITSYTKKALSVLKEKIAPGLQNLCVTMLDDSNEDMERSVDGITDCMARYTTFRMKEKMENTARERKDIISRLAEIRKTQFALLRRECGCIVYANKSVSPSGMADFVFKNQDKLDCIPGKVRRADYMPLTFEQLSTLYRSNELITAEDERELADDLPDPAELLEPALYETIWSNSCLAANELREFENSTGWKIEYDSFNGKLTVSLPDRRINIASPSHSALQSLKAYLATVHEIERWMQQVAVDGKKGAFSRSRWELLNQEIEETCAFAESIAGESFGRSVAISSGFDYLSQYDVYKTAYEQFRNHGKIQFLKRSFDRSLDTALKSIRIDGHEISNVDECGMIIHKIELERERKKCATYWDELLSPFGICSFSELDPACPEEVAANWVPKIRRYLNWYAEEYAQLENLTADCNISFTEVLGNTDLDNELQRTGKILFAVSHILPLLCEIIDAALTLRDCAERLSANRNTLSFGARTQSALCGRLFNANNTGDVETYGNNFHLLQKVYAKYSLQNKRIELLKTLESVAPDWAEAIRSHSGIHGSFTVPSDIEDAWKWKQYSMILEEIGKEPYEALQKESVGLSKQYRKKTAEYAEYSAWYHLLKRTEGNIDARQALQGWKQIVRRIGKGTGRTAPVLREEARKLMAKCQETVPAWIMPMGKALESLDPRINRFDVVIIDEASQADISSLAILYMGAKLIIVGDDEQVSPSAIGVEDRQIEVLRTMHLRGIPNAILYDAKRSIYDVAASTYQALMLKEHFRCVPDIIGFSNMLSYRGEIKPLRDAGASKLVPAVVSYRTPDGCRSGNNNTNRHEAENIVALMKACMEQPEYDGKTFGMISLLGDHQAALVQKLIGEHIEERVIGQRRILCGNSANFQGDERDVIFLSMVDSNEGEGPLRMMNEGPLDQTKKRYNVAASRAKDQLWVVHSLDPANDLKMGDLRKKLLDYAADPGSFAYRMQQAEENAESPFESAVAKALITRGYHLAQQLWVGAYRLDIVAICGIRKVAIECDGERFHSGAEKIREDMERQAILERAGWKFIRIPGSEYFKNPDKTIERVVSDLKVLGIEPENSESAGDSENPGKEPELLQRVKRRAVEILMEIQENDPQALIDNQQNDRTTIEAPEKNDSTVITETKNNNLPAVTENKKDAPPPLTETKKNDSSAVSENHENDFPAAKTEIARTAVKATAITSVPDESDENNRQSLSPAEQKTIETVEKTHTGNVSETVTDNIRTSIFPASDGEKTVKKKTEKNSVNAFTAILQGEKVKIPQNTEVKTTGTTKNSFAAILTGKKKEGK